MAPSLVSAEVLANGDGAIQLRFDEDVRIVSASVAPYAVVVNSTTAAVNRQIGHVGATGSVVTLVLSNPITYWDGAIRVSYTVPTSYPQAKITVRGLARRLQLLWLCAADVAGPAVDGMFCFARTCQHQNQPKSECPAPRQRQCACILFASFRPGLGWQ